MHHGRGRPDGPEREDHRGRQTEGAGDIRAEEARGGVGHQTQTAAESL